jgi:hypothetical protein
MKEKLYRQINVWEEIDEKTLCCYRVFEILSNNKFFCKGQDYFHNTLEEKELRSLEYYAVDSLFQGGLSMKIKRFDSIEEAIAQFKKDFS